MDGPEYISEGLRHLAVPIADLMLDPENARTHSDDNIRAIKANLVAFGQYQPIIVQKQGMVVSVGNGRVVAARELGWEYIAAIVIDESRVEAVRRAIADNRSGELAIWDVEVLVRLIEEIADACPASEMGFSEGAIEAFRKAIEEPTAPEDFPEFGDGLDTEYRCPKCAWEWSGNPKPDTGG